VYNPQKDTTETVAGIQQVTCIDLNMKFNRISLFAFLSILFLILVYAWLISFGLWTRWPTLTRYYDQLASAFGHGSLSLDLKPDAALVALSNPYDPAARAGLNALNDASLYEGRYYLYFGPVPALLLVIVKPFGLAGIGDQYLVFAFITGIFILQTFLIIKVWRRFFQDVPAWIIIPGIVMSGLATPLVSMLTKARVYEASIAGGQFFFLLGLYLIFTALDRANASQKHLLLGAISLALAIGSRVTQILPVGFITCMAAFWIFKVNSRSNSLSTAIRPLISLGAPLIIGLSVLGWYNWARFHSVFETGILYQLAWTDPQKNYREFFSPLYIIQNLYNYLFVPPKLRLDIFPFVFAVYGKVHPVFSALPMPEIYNSEKITGLLYSVPFTLYALVPVIGLLHGSGQQQKSYNGQSDPQLFNWFIAGLFGSFLFGFLSFLAFFWAALRYFEDFLPSLIILSMIGFWQGYRYVSARPTQRMAYLIIGIGLITVSIIASTLIGLSYGSPRFNEFNRLLWNVLQQ